MQGTVVGSKKKQELGSLESTVKQGAEEKSYFHILSAFHCWGHGNFFPARK
jgi:hypothetical protein